MLKEWANIASYMFSVHSSCLNFNFTPFYLLAVWGVAEDGNVVKSLIHEQNVYHSLDFILQLNSCLSGHDKGKTHHACCLMNTTIGQKEHIQRKSVISSVTSTPTFKIAISAVVINTDEAFPHYTFLCNFDAIANAAQSWTLGSSCLLDVIRTWPNLTWGMPAQVWENPELTQSFCVVLKAACFRQTGKHSKGASGVQCGRQ